jgi:hypothetical protein
MNARKLLYILLFSVFLIVFIDVTFGNKWSLHFSSIIFENENISQNLLSYISLFFTITFGVVPIIYSDEIKNKLFKINKSKKKNNTEIIESLLTNILNYQNGEGNTNSWSIKESSVILGKSTSPVEEPGLGIAIITTQLMNELFEKKIEYNLNLNVNWAINRMQNTEPFCITLPKRNENNEIEKWVVDFRHTIAFGIINARVYRSSIHIENCLRLVLKEQLEDGGWLAGEGDTKSNIFSALYSIEFLSLCKAIFKNKSYETEIDSALNRGLNWLINNYYDCGWNTNVLNNKFEKTWASSWVVFRLMQLDDLNLNQQWESFLAEILKTFEYIDNSKVYKKSKMAFLVEIRKAAAVSIIYEKNKNYSLIDEITKAKIINYLNCWKINSVQEIKKYGIENIDLASSVFLLYSIISREKLFEIANKFSLKYKFIHIDYL